MSIYLLGFTLVSFIYISFSYIISKKCFSDLSNINTEFPDAENQAVLPILWI